MAFADLATSFKSLATYWKRVTASKSTVPTDHLAADGLRTNFNFRDGKRGGEDTGEPPVSAVDFQYTGVGVGVVDLQYLLTAFPPVDGLSQHEVALIDHYFHVLQAPSDVEEEWRALYSVAVADFQRFLAGWGGGSWRHRSGSIARHCAAAVEKCKTTRPID